MTLTKNDAGTRKVRCPCVRSPAPTVMLWALKADAPGREIESARARAAIRHRCRHCSGSHVRTPSAVLAMTIARHEFESSKRRMPVPGGARP